VIVRVAAKQRRVGASSLARVARRDSSLERCGSKAEKDLLLCLIGLVGPARTYRVCCISSCRTCSSSSSRCTVRVVCCVGVELGARGGPGGPRAAERGREAWQQHSLCPACACAQQKKMAPSSAKENGAVVSPVSHVIIKLEAVL